MSPAPKATRDINDFIWSLKEEPHATRRMQIFKDHPEVKQLFGFEWRTKYIVFFLVSLQLSLAYLLREMAFTWQFWLVAYVVGATASQALFLAIHEISHFLAFRSFTANKILSIFANAPLIAPYAISFRPYHMEHHKYQGVDGVDVDIPTKIETQFFRTALTKLVFLTFQILFYALRPVFVRQQVFTLWHLTSIVSQLCINALILNFCGWGGLQYLFCSTFLSASLHPCASHFIAEHYVFTGEVETYSYYGPLNALCFNVGYHNEHHDFPNIPWSRLPMLREMAKEYYQDLPQHSSWPMVLVKFVMDPNVSTSSRVKRPDTTGASKKLCGATKFE